MMKAFVYRLNIIFPSFMHHFSLPFLVIYDIEKIPGMEAKSIFYQHAIWSEQSFCFLIISAKQPK